MRVREVLDSFKTQARLNHNTFEICDKDKNVFVQSTFSGEVLIRNDYYGFGHCEVVETYIDQTVFVVMVKEKCEVAAEGCEFFIRNNKHYGIGSRLELKAV